MACLFLYIDHGLSRSPEIQEEVHVVGLSARVCHISHIRTIHQPGGQLYRKIQR